MRPTIRGADRQVRQSVRSPIQQEQGGVGASQAALDCNQQLLQLLQKISSQLDEMPVQNTQKQTKQTQTAQSEEKPGVNNSQVTGNLQELFEQLLTAKQGSNKSQNTQVQSPKESSSNQSAAIPAQTAAQVLAQAQFELSQELEASLQKLKQVITESENIAARIGNLLENETSSQK